MELAPDAFEASIPVALPFISIRRSPRRWRVTHSAIVGCAALLLASAGCAGSKRPIRIGAPGPWSRGSNLLQQRGIELAIAEVNARGGIRGRPLELVIKDDRADPTQAVRIAQEYIDDREMLAVVGHVNSGTLIAAAQLYNGRMPVVAATATSPDLTGVSPWVFRVVGSDSLSGASLARSAIALGWRRAAILYENDTYGRGLAAAFRGSYGGKIISMDPIGREMTSDFEPYLAYFADRRPDVVFVASSEDTGIRLLQQAHRLGLRSAFLGADGWSGIVTDTAAAEGAYVGVPFVVADPRPETRTFVDAFRARYHVDPDAPAALAYDATTVVIRALEAAGPDRARVRDYLASLDSGQAVAGVTGAIRFRRTGDPDREALVLAQVRRGSLEVVTR